MAINPPLCPTCGQPASPALPTHDYDWECRNDDCPQEGLPISAEATSSN